MRIRGAMIDHLRRHATICPSAMARRKPLPATRARLEQKLGRVPTDAEMSAEMGLSPAAYRQLADRRALDPPHSTDERHSYLRIWFTCVWDRAGHPLWTAFLKQDMTPS